MLPQIHYLITRMARCYVWLINSLSPSDINFALRKIVCMLKPTKQIVHDPATGSMKIRTLTTFKDFDMDFKLGQVFTEDLGPVDGRVCQVCVFTVLHVWLGGWSLCSSSCAVSKDSG